MSVGNPRLGYWAAQEQYSMEQLIGFVQEAERNGFSSTMTSDHFHPWRHDNAYGNFTWVWIAAAAARTKGMQFVTGVTAPVYRYHPAIIAQAFASLDVLYPGRIGIGLGTGEAMNEYPLGFDWPRPRARLTRLEEAVQMIKKLWYGGGTDDDFVDFNGEYFLLRRAHLYTPPSGHIPLYIAASGPKATEAAAKYSDGLITYLKPSEAGKILEIFDRTIKNEREPGLAPEKIAEFKVSFSDDYEGAFQSATFWRSTLIKGVFDSEISDPRKLQQKAEHDVSDEELEKAIRIMTSIEDCIKPLEEYFRAGFTKVYVHSTSPDEIKFVQAFCKKVMPHFAQAGTAVA